ncbi:MAG: cache domain-containing protein [Candidatus Omnitrophota bacterium]
MKNRNLKFYIFSALFLQVIVTAILMAILGYYTIQHDIVARAQREVARKIEAAQIVYDNELEKIRTALVLTRDAKSLISVKGILDVDYVYEVPASLKDTVKSDIARAAFAGNLCGGSRIIEADELKAISNVLLDRVKTKIEYTPKAKPDDKRFSDSALAIEYAMPIMDEARNVSAVRYAGRIINRDFALVDNIRDVVFGHEFYDNMSVGTVTIFQDDVRIATNVLNHSGERAIGTRVSEEVYDRVMRKGASWNDRAFVVSGWYLTAYKPIKNLADDTIGILYVGMLEKPFNDLRVKRFLMFLVIIAIAAFLALFASFMLASKILSPLYKALDASGRISEGDLSCRLTENSSIREFDRLAGSFNAMAMKLAEREKSLISSKQEYEAMSKSYLDLVGFVSHELKGILASIVLNAYSLRNKLLGPVNEAQSKALDSVARNLDYLTQTVKNFLNLSRIEKQEMVLRKTEFFIKNEIFDASVEGLIHQAEEKKMTIHNDIAGDIKVTADSGLLRIAANNLLTNAIKYGKRDGKINLSSRVLEDYVEIEVYNEGKPISVIDVDRLFKKFSRLHYEGEDKVKGTGIGLFITKEIIRLHGGSIRVEPRPNGNSFIFSLRKG